MKGSVLSYAAATVLFLLVFTTAEARVKGIEGDWVKIVDQDTHYRVTIDYSKGGSRTEVGAEYMELIQHIYPDYESVADGYLAELEVLSSYGAVPPVMEMIEKAKAILPQLPSLYREEIEGMSLLVTGGATDVPGDGLLSVNEMYVLSLMPDVSRAYSCSGISFWGENTRKGRTITGRNLDWNMGKEYNFNQIHAVTTIINEDNVLTLVGFLGNLGMISGVNDSGVFAAILDAPVGGPPMEAEGSRSYYMDLRSAMEQAESSTEVAEIMVELDRKYVFNHNILLSDPQGSFVVEIYLFGDRRVRYADSALNENIEWPYYDALGVVNSFLLEDNPENHLLPWNAGRWGAFLDMVEELQLPVSLGDVQDIMSYGEGPTNEHIYRGEAYMLENSGSGTLQQIFYQSGKKYLIVSFCPKDGPVLEPRFEEIPIQLKQKGKKCQHDGKKHRG